MGERLSIETPSTLLFDHPTTVSVVQFMLAQSTCDDGVLASASIFFSCRDVVVSTTLSSKRPPILEQGYSIFLPGTHFIKAGLKELAQVGIVAC